MESKPPGTGPLPSRAAEFTGVDPELMDGFITKFGQTDDLLGEPGEVARRLLALGALPAPSPAPPGEARGQGRDLAARYNAIDPDPACGFNPGLDRKYLEIIAELGGYVLDPEFTAAFFAGLGLERTLALPCRLDRAMRTTAPDSLPRALDLVSRAFGTAVSGGSTTAGFETLTEDAKRAPAVARLLSAGRFPTAWLAEVAALQVFTPGNQVRGAALTPYLNALADDPAAARLAIGLSTRDSPASRAPLWDVPCTPADRRPDLAGFLRELDDRAGIDETSADAFGRLLMAASGAREDADRGHPGRRPPVPESPKNTEEYVDLSRDRL